jgi:hypothetical protein
MQWLLSSLSGFCLVTGNESQRRRRKNSWHFNYDSEFMVYALRHPLQAAIGILAVSVPHACSDRVYADADYNC